MATGEPYIKVPADHDLTAEVSESTKRERERSSPNQKIGLPKKCKRERSCNKFAAAPMLMISVIPTV